MRTRMKRSSKEEQSKRVDKDWRVYLPLGSVSPARRRGLSIERSLAQQQNQDDERDWNSNQPEKNGHVSFLSSVRNA